MGKRWWSLLPVTLEPPGRQASGTPGGWGWPLGTPLKDSLNRLTDVGRATLSVGLSPGPHQKDAGRALGSLLSASLLLPWWLFLSRHFYQSNKEKQQQNQPEVVRAEGSLGVPVPVDQITCLCAPLEPSLPWRLREIRWGTCLEIVTELPAFRAMARKHIDCMPRGSNRLP